MRRITSDDIVRMEKKRSNKVGLVLIIIFAIALLGGGGYLLLINHDKIDWNIKLPWEKEEEKKENNKKEEQEEGDKKRNDKLIIPRVDKNSESIYIGGSELKIDKIETDSKGFLITVALKTKSPTATINVKSILVDGYYVSASFELTDNKDVAENVAVTQLYSKKQFRISQSELDDIGIVGFNQLKFFYDYEEPKYKEENFVKVIDFQNDIYLGSERKGLIQIDQIDTITVSYYKTVFAADATYIYFDFHSNNVKSQYEVSIKKLKINNALYEMPNFKETLHYGAQEAYYIEIPKDKISKVKNIEVSFFLIKENGDEPPLEIFITNDYYREF